MVRTTARGGGPAGYPFSILNDQRQVERHAERTSTPPWMPRGHANAP